MAEEFRVEVDLEDPEHGHATERRIRALDLDEDARERLGSSVMVTRDGSRVFLYAVSESQAREAERVVRGLVAADALTAEIHLTRWHPLAEEWRDASIPLPASSEEEAAERASREAAEVREAEIEGDYDWHVVVRAAGRGEAIDLASRLVAEELPVRRRWRYVTVGVLTEERAEELAERLRSELSEDDDVRIEVDLSDVARSPLQFLPF
jgi:hypothetical protein